MATMTIDDLVPHVQTRLNLSSKAKAKEAIQTVLGVISDTHLRGPDDRLLAIVRTHFHDAGMVLHAGDLVDLAVLEAFGDRDVFAVCGNMVSPPLGETMALVGRDDCLARIDRARTMAL